MKVKGKNKLVLEKYLPRSKTVRMRILWSYDMAMVWICAYLALGLRFDLSLSSVPIEYAREVWKYGLLQMVMVSLVFLCGAPLCHHVGSLRCPGDDAGHAGLPGCCIGTIRRHFII